MLSTLVRLDWMCRGFGSRDKQSNTLSIKNSNFRLLEENLFESTCSRTKRRVLSMSVEIVFEDDSVWRARKQRWKNRITYNYINSDLYDSLRARVERISIRLSRNDVVFLLLFFLFNTIGYNAQTGVCVYTRAILTSSIVLQIILFDYSRTRH